MIIQHTHSLTGSQPCPFLILKPRQLAIDQLPEWWGSSTDLSREAFDLCSVDKLGQADIDVATDGILETVEEHLGVLETVELVVAECRNCIEQKDG